MPAWQILCPLCFASFIPFIAQDPLSPGDLDSHSSFAYVPFCLGMLVFNGPNETPPTVLPLVLGSPAQEGLQPAGASPEEAT